MGLSTRQASNKADLPNFDVRSLTAAQALTERRPRKLGLKLGKLGISHVGVRLAFADISPRSSPGPLRVRYET